MTNAIHTKYAKTTVSFKVSCSAIVSGPGFPAGGQRVPVDGMVVADAESSDPNPDEYIKVETSSNAQWRVLDRIRDSGCTSTTLAQQSTSGGSRTLTLLPGGVTCPNTGPTVAMVASNVSEATITMFGQGQAAAAVGAVINLDYGDAPTQLRSRSRAIPDGLERFITSRRHHRCLQHQTGMATRNPT